ncbi:4-coumarate--CoA ligase 1 [Nasonia vitripennis]|uniref:Luciferin 4-monooxygenase n=1 Tax=Nasonia vitripennis TaxID=7425 RepID=A0A7M7IRQ6_NASVI|nr:4-coumarate--CoA ligase 1 [Nasonia vitripennis]XP_016841716.1 4-coumarate--CoA ligase 1 [Nasonia vitripennis]XP_031788586.1 4-coumarate--CoA ligase 1 [Nasonia vitripennis]
MNAIMRRALRTAIKLEVVTPNVIKIQSRCMSNAAQAKVVEGTNGEKIIPSPYGQLTYPEMRISDYVWESLQDYSNMVALQCGVTNRKYTYAQARDYANYVARSLLDIGVKPGEVVALILPNLPETAIAFLGCLEAGIVITTVNPIYTADEIARQLISSGTKAVITAAEISSTVITAVNKSIPGGRVIVVNDHTKPIPDGVIPFEDLITKGKTLAPLPDRQWSLDDVAILPYSSGTTGLPKGVMLTHRNIVSNVEMVKNTVDKHMMIKADGSSQEIVPVVLPMYHIYGMSTIMLSRLSIGSRLITLPKFTPESYIKVLDENKVSVLMLVPPIVLFLSASKHVTRKHLENVTSITSGAAPLSKTDVDKFYDKFNVDRSKTQFAQGYGLTESSPVALFEKSGVKFSSIGKPVCGSEARLVDPITKKDVHSPGQTGELWIRGPHIMKGYLKNQKATEETIVDGWLLTGDIAYYDDDLDFYITDRLKELIKVKGYQVAPAELEALLRTHPNVEEAGVIGIPDERAGEVPKAFVVLKNKGETKPEEIQNFIKGKVSEFKELRGGVQFIDTLPKNPSGKILRSKLKQDYC